MPVPKTPQEGREALLLYLRMLTGRTVGPYLELRLLERAERDISHFIRVDRLADAVPVIVELGARETVYIGVLPRLVRGGRKEHVARANVLWVDADTTDAVRALRAF